MRLSAPIHRLKRDARDHARASSTPLHAALDQMAVNEGYKSWSHLAASAAHAPDQAEVLLSSLKPGELVLIGARPQQGKTMFALRLLLLALAAGRDAHFFSLDYNRRDVDERLSALPPHLARHAKRVNIDCSDAISASHIIDHLASAPRGTVVAVDYLQLLDQKRTNPPLQDQVEALSSFAKPRGIILTFISQIDRSFDADKTQLPELADIRLPNPLDLRLFSRAIFLHGGRLVTSTR